MYEKYNFASYFIFGFTLVYALGLFLGIWHIRGGGPIYEVKFIALQSFALGIYSIFIENEFLNTHPYYQIFIVAMSTCYQVINSLAYFSRWRVYWINELSIIIWSLLALKVHDKSPNYLVKAFRFGIGYTVLDNLLTSIPIDYVTRLIACFILSISFIFINHLTLEKVSFYSSLYLYSHMVALGITAFISEFYFSYRFLREPIFFYILAGMFFVVGLYYQYKKQKSQYILIGDDQTV